MGLRLSSIADNFIEQEEENNETSDNGTNKKQQIKNKTQNGENKFASNNFIQISKELKNKQNIKENIYDDNTKLNLTYSDIGTKSYEVYATRLKLQQFNSFTNGEEMLFIKFKKKYDEDAMPLTEVRKYVSLSNGEITFIKPVTPEKIYQITKALNREFYFAVNQQDQVIPMSPWQAKQIVANKNHIKLNKNLHISKIYNKNNMELIPPMENLSDNYIQWFNKTINHHHPYAYADMVIPDQVKKYNFTKKGSDGRTIKVHSQFSNELTQKEFNDIEDLRNFVAKVNLARLRAKRNMEEYVFAMPFPLYDQKHMLSIVVVVKPSGKINITIVNANRSPTAKKDYGDTIKRIIQKAFKHYAKNNKSLKKIVKTVKYYFHENNSQYGPTCMTHADCITRQIAKDPDFEKDSHDIHPIKIWEKAYLRGFASNLYKKAKRQGKFIPDNIKKIENEKIKQKYNIKKKKINNKSPKVSNNIKKEISY